MIKLYKNKLNALINISLSSLKRMYNEGENLFCHKLTIENNKIVKSQASIRYSAIALIGLYKYSSKFDRINLNLEKINLGLVDKINVVDNIGDLGLILWQNSLSENKSIKTIFHTILEFGEPYQCRSNLFYHTMELSWLLSGLCFAYKYNPTQLLKNYVIKIKKLILNNYNSKSNLFYHSNKKEKFSSFNNQTYSIYALSLFHDLFHDKDALNIIADCSKRICSLQGSLGAWWWIYNVEKGEVEQKYPVFSVHQDGMALMALSLSSKVTKLNFDTNLSKSLEWIFGNNILKKSLVDMDKQIVYRSIKQMGEKLKILKINKSKPLVTVNNIFWFNFQNLQKKHPVFLNIDKECRPYHLGWMLYTLTDLIS